jgi:hypothetical protein
MISSHFPFLNSKISRGISFKIPDFKISPIGARLLSNLIPYDRNEISNFSARRITLSVLGYFYLFNFCLNMILKDL